MEEFDELRGRFEKAVLEIRAMRKELREAHTIQDALELEIFAHKQDASRVTTSNTAQVQLMAARIQDLTTKLAGSEKQVRTLKQKLTKSETREKRRSLSLKGRESFQISQELEDKLLDLETKISLISRGKTTPAPVPSKDSSNSKKETKRDKKTLDRARLRRKSLDSATSSEPMKVLIRLSTLETKVAHISETMPSDAEKDSSECSETTTASTSTEISTEILTRLKKLERVVAKSKRRLEKCLGSTQAEEKAEKCLREVNDILESCLECKKNQQSTPQIESVGLLVAKLETILREKLSELTQKRQSLSEANKLDERAKLELLAERIAFESVVLRQIKRAINKTSDRSTILGKLVETSHLISNFKSKVYGTKPKIYQNTSYVQYLTRILANKLVMITGSEKRNEIQKRESKEIQNARKECRDYLVRKQSEVDDIMLRYRETKLRELAEVLAAETLSLSDQEDRGKQIATSNKLLEDRRIRQAWAYAQESVNKELVQTEVSHVIMRYGQIYEQNINTVADCCFNFEDSEIVSHERWADEAREKLREVMEFSVRELTEAYEEAMERMKKSRESLFRGSFDSRQLLNDYGDVVAQKALIDARISLMKEDERDDGEGGCETSFVSSLIKLEDVLASFFDEWREEEIDPVVEAEFKVIYGRFERECEQRIGVKGRGANELKNVVEAIGGVEEELDELKRCLWEKDRKEEERSSRGNTILDWEGLYFFVYSMISFLD